MMGESTMPESLETALDELPQGEASPEIQLTSDATFTDSWEWPSQFETFIRDEISEKEGPIVNIPAGNSALGDVKIDAEPRQPDVFASDMSDLSLPTDSVGVIVSDPPWRVQDVDARKAWFEELVKVGSPGGVILYNAGWIPEHDDVKQLDVRPRVDDDVGTVSYLTLFWIVPEFGEDPEAVQQRYAAKSGFAQNRTEADIHEHNVQTQYPEFPGDADLRCCDPREKRYSCPKCGCSVVLPTDRVHAVRYFECSDCRFRATRAEVVDRSASRDDR